MSNKPIPTVYIKRGCSWCREALAFFSQHGVDVEVRDVHQSPQNMQRMVEISGQSLTPTFEHGEFVVSDFSIDEFLEEIEQVPKIKKELGFGNNEDWR